MTDSILIDAIKECRFRDWDFEVSPLPDGWKVRARFDAPDNYSNPENKMTQWTRWWVIDQDCAPADVAKTLLLCVLTAVEHEAREEFFYKGKRIFSPHRSP